MNAGAAHFSFLLVEVVGEGSEWESDGRLIDAVLGDRGELGGVTLGGVDGVGGGRSGVGGWFAGGVGL